MRDFALTMALIVLPSFTAILFSLALVYAAQAQEYPPGLFERSPLVEPQGSPRKPQGSPRTGVYRSHATQNPASEAHMTQPASEAAEGSCKHYREWFYPWPQPCHCLRRRRARLEYRPPRHPIYARPALVSLCGSRLLPERFGPFRSELWGGGSRH